MSKTALILFAHGARDPDWVLPLERVKAAVRAQSAGQRVELAFLELMTPTLQDCVASLLAEDFERIVILPMLIAQGGHFKKDMTRSLAEMRQRNPQIVFELAGPVGEVESVIQAMAAQALTLAAEPK